MKTLWVNSNFMHPTTKGGQIRTLEMLRHLHRWHEIHYVAIDNPAQPEGPARAHEYSHKSYPFTYRVPVQDQPRVLRRTGPRTLLSHSRSPSSASIRPACAPSSKT